MAKNVLRYGEFQISDDVLNISSLDDVASESGLQELDDLTEEYTGPTADELRREADLFKAQWEKEKARMETESHTMAHQIVQKAEDSANEQIHKQRQLLEEEQKKAELESQKIMDDARAEAERILAEAQGKVQEIEEEARKKGEEEGQEKGYETGKREVERLINHLHAIINKMIERRNGIIEESEAQLVQLVLQIAAKIIKLISEKQRNVVITNIVQALKKLKARADVIIRVNITDLKITTSHAEDFIKRVERVNNVVVMEDSTVDPGGAIIETDFGQIDARISSQLKKIEDAVVNLMPVSNVGKVK